MNRWIKGIAFFAGWFVGGGILAIIIAEHFLIASIGGYADPPAIWTIARDLGLSVMPVLLLFGGVPAAVQIVRGRRWQTTAFVSLIVCGVSWAALMIVVWSGPDIFGWTW